MPRTEHLSPPDDWSPPERRLWEAFRHGAELDLGGRPHPATAAPESEHSDEPWGPERTVRAEVIARLLLHGPEPLPGAPARLILKGARVSGRLDLGCAEPASFLFTHCVFDQAPFLNDAKARFIGFTHCRLPGLDAARIGCAGPVWLHDTRIDDGPVNLPDAEIGGELSLHGITVDAAQAMPAVLLNGARVAGGLDLGDALITGTVSMGAARIGGDLLLNGAELTAPDGWALYAPNLAVGASVVGGTGLRVTGGVFLEGATIAGDMWLDQAEVSRPSGIALLLDHCRVALAVHCENARIRGTVRLHHMTAGCHLTLKGATVSDVAADEDAVRADHLEVDGSLILTDADLAGPLSLHGARIACNLVLSGARLSAPAGAIALTADGAHVGNHLLARKWRCQGAAMLTALRVDGDADLTDAVLANDSHTALDLCRAVLSGSLRATGSFSATGSIGITDARVGVDLVLTGATLRNPQGRALAASGLHVAGDLSADRCTVTGLVDLADARIDGDLRFVDAALHGRDADEPSPGAAADAQGDRWNPAMRCTGARVGGDIDLRRARLTRGLALNRATAGHAVRLDGATLATEGPYALQADELTAETLVLKPAAPPDRAVSLAAAHVQELVDGAGSWPETAPVTVSGFRYERLDSDLSVAARLRWLAHATPVHEAGPYEQLAACFELAGRAGDARTVRLAAIRRAYRSKNPVIRAWGGLQDAVVGYGYAPARALAIFVLLLVGASLWFSFGVTGCLPESPGLCPVKADEHPTWDPWLYSLDLLIPLVDLGHEKAWDPLGASKAVAMVLTMSGWVLTTTVIAAAGRILRRT